MKNNLEKRIDLERKICDLVSSAKFFINQTEKINNIHKKTKSDRNLFTIHSVLYFSYALSVFNTLFEKKSNEPQEQSFEQWRKLKNSISEEEESFLRIINLYNKSNFKKFRNKIIDHRDYKNAGDVLANFLNPVKDSHIKTAKILIKEIEIHIKKYFSEDGVEYNFSIFYQNSMNNFMDILRKNYEN